MEANISRKFKVDEPVQKVWAGLSDPIRVSGCVPGASITEEVDEHHYKGEVVLKLGPVKAKFEGEITLVEMDPELNKMVIRGKGLDAKGKGSAEMSMTGIIQALGNQSEVDFEMKVSIQGKLAQFGSRLINDVSDQLMGQFIENFKAMLAGEEFNKDLKAGKIMGKMLKDKVSGVFRKKTDETD